MKMVGIGVYCHTDVRKWYQLRLTPFWLEVWGEVLGTVWKKNWHMVRGKLAPLENENPPRLVIDPTSGFPVIPLFPLVGVERAELIADLLRQLREVHQLLASAGG
jgi:hypothetical protein